MDLVVQYPFPPINGLIPKWNGKEFELGSVKKSFLCYDQTQSGWCAELTAMHEKEAGEGNHPIDRLSRYYAHVSMKTALEQRGIVLDVGCSSGFLLHEIRSQYPEENVIGADYLQDIVRQCAKKLPSVPMLQFDLRGCPLPDNSLDAVVALNVLEHIDDDEKALGHIFRILKPGGVAHIEVPGGAALYDFYDEVLMHHRRYGRKEIIKKCKNAGFRVIRAFGIGWMIYPMFFAIKKKNRWLGQRLSDEEKKRRVASAIKVTKNSKIIKSLLDIESMITQIIHIHFGVRQVVVLEK